MSADNFSPDNFPANEPQLINQPIASLGDYTHACLEYLPTECRYKYRFLLKPAHLAVSFLNTQIPSATEHD